ncbi:hemagglutinin repeat-containing protein [Ralstonia chuxiongensis]|uniref:hemagglutinin repeat-containing protein n=1 Tax=Ralstonia chuxiongensis TaxID=2957504 RepID=UPI0028F57E4D|nr:hemagglutinin repeat-containing protein [Ralstonia chuxiongensis]CAJ0783967.1 hypothetical protein R8510_05197 [Ralstonia chuxiongensis]
MNKNLYRVVFNAARGMLLAVEESASSTGKGRNAGSRTRRRAGVALLAAGTLASPGLHSQSITPDRSVAGPHPVVGVAANGTPVVQINAPSAAGVSANAFTNYNVGGQGLVLNNSGQNSQTQIAGWIQGNPFLGNNAARVILNQVTSGNASTLAGPTEIAGNQASLIVANPAGITCAGCSFIQAPRVTLTTGTPNFDALGNIASLAVQQGQITINGAGLDAHGAQLDLLSRAMAINGQVWAERLNAVAGANSVDYGTTTPTAIAGVGPAPQVAIDVGQLGSMYGGGATRLIGTEQGVGVNIGGNLAALTGTLNVAANGDVTITPSGHVQSAGDMGISGPNVTNQGAISSPGNVAVSGNITNTGTLVAGSNATVTGAQITNAGTIAAGVDSNGNLSQVGDVALAASGAVRNSGSLLAGKNVGVTANLIDASNGNVSAQGKVSLAATGDVSTRGATITGNSIGVQTAGALDNSGGQVYSQRTLQVGAQRVVNQYGLLAAVGDVGLDTGLLDNTAGALGSNTGNVTINSTGAVTNANGKLLAGQDATVNAASLGNQAGAISARNLTLNTGVGALDNTQGTVSATGAATVSAGNLVNQGGTFVAANDLKATVASLDNTAGTLGSTTGNLNVNSSGALVNASGKLAAGQDVSLTGTSLNNQAGEVSGRNLAVNTGTGTLDNAAGSLSASGAASLQSGALVNQKGSIVAGQDVNATVASLDNTNGTLGSSAGNLNLSSAGTIVSTGGKLIAAQDATLTGTRLNNQAGTVSARNLSVNTGTGTVDNSAGSMAASGATTIAAGQLINQGGSLSAVGDVTANVASLDNTSGVLGSSSANLNVQSTGAITNAGGKLLATQDATLKAASLGNQGGTVSARNLSVDTGAGTVDNTNGSISASGTANVQAGSLVNHGGSLAAVGDVTTTVASLDNSVGTLGSVQGNLTVNSAGTVNNGGGKFLAAQDIGVSAASLGNQGGTVSGRNVSVQLGAGALDNTAGVVAAAGALDTTAGVITNTNGLLQAGSTLTSHSQTLTNTNGSVVGNAVALQADTLTNQQGTVSSKTTLNVQSQALNNDQGRLVSNGALTAEAGNLTNVGGVLASNADATVSGTTLDNSAGLMHAGSTLSVSGATVLNRNTNTATLGMEGANVAVNATSAFDNTSGAVRSDQSTQVTAPLVNNTQGSMQSAGTVGVTASNALTNTQGNLNGSKQTTVTAGQMTGDGTVQSQGSVALNLHSDYNNTGTVAAGQDVFVATTGNVTNAGTMSAGRNLAVSANNITNTQTGQLIGNVSNTLTAQQTLSNDGLIDGGATVVKATDVVNTGRLYGDTVAIGANTLTNTVNAQGVAGVIASRGDMDLGVQTLNNQEHALIYSAGDMRIGGALDANNHATGSAQTVKNGSATINADGNLTVAATQVLNQNNHFATTDQTSAGAHITSYRLNGSTQDIDPSTIRLFQSRNGETTTGDNWQWLGNDDYKVLLLPSAQYPFDRYGPPFTYSNSQGGGGAVGTAYIPEMPCSADACTVSSYPEQFLYKTTDAIWGVFGITPPQEIGTQPDPSTYQPSQYPQYQADLAAWQQRHDAAVAQYQVLNTAINAFNRNVRGREVDAFTIYDGTQQITRTVVTQSDPALMTSGGNMTLNAGTVTNLASQIVAGGDLTGSNIIGTKPNNVGMQGTQTSTTTGTARYTYVESGGAFSGDTRSYNTSPWQGQTIQTNFQLDVSATSGTGPNSQHAVKSVPVAATAGQGNGASALVPGQTSVGGSGLQAGNPSLNAPSVGTVRAAPTTVSLPGGIVIRTVVPNLTLPNNALYRVIGDPGSHVLVETDPRFTNYRSWLSSDFMLDQFQNDPNATLKRIGDGFYEQQLIQQEIIRATGQRFLGDYTSNEAEYKALLSNGVTFGKAFGLNVGTALSDAQMAQLTSDIVWMVKQTVTLADGSQQTVLVPQVYLRAKSTDIDGSGTLMAGRNVSFQTDGDAVNSGTIASKNVTIITADNIQNSGTLAGSTLLAQAKTDLNNLGGHIQADQALLSAGRDVNIASTTVSTKNATTTGSNINQVASVDAGALSIKAGRDANLTAAAINSVGDSTITASRDVNLKALRQSSDEHVVWGDKNRSDRSSYADVGTQIQTGGNLAIGAGQDVNATGAYANATGGIQVAATRDVNLNAGQSHQDVRDEHFQSEKGFLSTKTTHTIDSAGQTNAVGTTLSGDTVTVAAGRDLTAKGATVAGTGDVNLAAGNNLTVTTADTSTSESHFKDVKKSGLGSAGAGISYGTNQVTDTSNDTVRGSQGSLIGSTDGSVHMQAGKDLHITGSDVVAGQNVTGIAQNVTIDASTTDRHHDNTHETKSSGFTLAVKSPVIDAIQNVQQQAEAAGHSQNGRAAALHAMAAVDGLGGVLGAADGAASALANGQKPEAKIELSWGSQQSKTTQTEDSTQHNGSNVKAGGTAAFVGTGDGTPGSGNVNIVGSDVNAKNVLLQANNQVNLKNSTDADSTRSTNESKSASVGVSYGTGGFGVSASMSKAHGDANSDAQTQNNTHINASDTATIVSGGDTNIVGANVNANKVLADIGGNLNIASTQDTSHSTSHQESTGGGFSISQGGGSANFSHSNGSANGSYAGVNEQSGIQAGSGGFDINVKGNTDLKGAYIASNATPDKNQVTTGTLTFSDIQNHSDYSANSSGFSLGGSVGNGGNNYRTAGPESGKNMGGGAPMLAQSDSGSDNATTRSAISQGTITLTDEAKQKQDLASLSRDTSSTNGKVSKTPDLQNLLNNQADMMAAAQAAGEVVARNIGAYADAKRDAAAAAGDTAGVEAWKEGGLARAGMQAAGSALVAGLGGGNIAGAAAGGGAASLAGGKLNELAGEVAGSHPTGNADVDQALGNIVANGLGTALGGLAGGTAGAFSGYNVDRFNRQLDAKEQKAIFQKANGDMLEAKRLTRAACFEVKCWAEYPQGSEKFKEAYVSLVEAASLEKEIAWVKQQKEAGLFDYTAMQKAADAVSSDPLGVAKDALKVGLGLVTAKTGATFCYTTGAGCIAGGPMIAFGLSDAGEGADGLYNRFNGIYSPGVNVLRYGMNQLSPTWGNTAYDGLNLLAGVLALNAQVLTCPRF